MQDGKYTQLWIRVYHVPWCVVCGVWYLWCVCIVYGVYDIPGLRIIILISHHSSFLFLLPPSSFLRPLSSFLLPPSSFKVLRVSGKGVLTPASEAPAGGAGGGGFTSCVLCDFELVRLPVSYIGLIVYFSSGEII